MVHIMELQLEYYETTDKINSMIDDNDNDNHNNNTVQDKFNVFDKNDGNTINTNIIAICYIVNFMADNHNDDKTICKNFHAKFK